LYLPTLPATNANIKAKATIHPMFPIIWRGITLKTTYTIAANTKVLNIAADNIALPI
jgi:hypothetical protein